MLLCRLYLRHDFLEGCVDFICPVLQRFTLVRVKLRFPITFNLQFPVLPYQVTSGKKFFHAFEKGILSCPIRQAQINLQHLLVQFLYESRLFHNLTYRRPIEQFPVLCLVIVERLRPKMVTQAEKLLTVYIPQCECEHPMQMVCHVISPFFISLRKNL